MHQITFDSFRKIIHEAGGISLGDDKTNLLRTRIRSRLAKRKVDSPESYLKLIQSDDTGQELTHLIDSIATNYTFFFREKRHFEYLENHLRSCLNKGQTKFRFWSAASSSGEEPYSMAMTALNLIRSMGKNPDTIDLKILATDISTKILKKAIQGCYKKNQLSKVPKEWQDSYFEKKKTPYGEEFQASQELKDRITFRHLNLNAASYPMRGPFDAIFCRNVMIYFDEPTRKTLVNKFSRLMANGAPLFVGMTESIMGYCDNLPYDEPSVYCKKS